MKRGPSNGLPGGRDSLDCVLTRIGKIKGVFSAPPDDLPSRLTTGAALIGNGDLLAAVGGESHELLFWLSKLDFWEAREEAVEKAGARTLGPLVVSIPQLRSATYRLEQSICDATVRGWFANGGAALTFEASIPRGENVLVLQLRCDGAEPLAIRPSFRMSGGPDAWPDPGPLAGPTGVRRPGVPGPSTVESGCEAGIAWCERRFEAPGLTWPSMAAVAWRERDAIVLAPGETATLVIAAATNHEGGNHRARAVERVRAADSAWIQAARRRHEAWWRRLWERCAHVETGSAYLEEQYYGSLYVTAACCGNPECAPGLFGWITHDDPCWGGDYHTNYNYESAWFGVLTANLVDLADCYHRPVMDYLPRMREYARRYLGVRGAYCNVGFGPKGINASLSDTPYDDGMNFLGQKSDASFLAVIMIMRYYLTMDADYARAVAYPFVTQVMDFWEDYLDFEDGRYVARNDTVNELDFWRMLEPGHRDFERARDSNNPLSLGLIRMVARAALDMSAALGVDAGRREKWAHILGHISDFPLTERGGRTVFACCEQGLTTVEEVNMCSLQHIYPAGCVGLSSGPELLRIACDTIAYKDVWAGGNSFSTIFQIAARVGFDPATILEKMESIARAHSRPNFMFRFGGGGIENNAGVPAGINEMLMQSHEGVIRLFPCWPAGRPAAFRRIRARGAFLVSAAWDGRDLLYAEIESEKGMPCAVRFGDRQVALSLKAGERVRLDGALNK